MESYCSFTLGALCQQGCAFSPNGISSRISFIFIFIFTVLLYQYYSASIVSILIMTPARFIKTLRDLAYSTLILGCEDVLYNRDYINKLVNDTVVNRLSKKSPYGTDASFYVEPEVGLPKVAAGGYAYHVELATAYPIISKTFDEDAICSLDEIQLFQLQQMHQPLQKGSEFREMLDYVLHRIDESGLMYRQLKHWHAKKPECIRSRPATSSVSIEEFYPALSMLLLGILFSVFVFIVEHIMHVHQMKQQEQMMIQDLRIDKKHGLITRVRH
ncbi:ionotropic receptor 75a-like [Atheta coriaria]|uniref:ionotropic receptor 75a-like n=1 Tax=Dalotia coriaria TaxID=877792 RepID=UPI0031F3DE98